MVHGHAIAATFSIVIKAGTMYWAPFQNITNVIAIVARSQSCEIHYYTVQQQSRIEKNGFVANGNTSSTIFT